jgi:transcriptional antiterminator RfaH
MGNPRGFFRGRPDCREDAQALDCTHDSVVNTQTILNNSLPSAASFPAAEESAWFCLRSHPKHEHIAAANLAKLEGVTVFNPRLRRRVTTRRGLVWVTESLFPGYVFARFAFHEMFNEVRYTASVSSVVHFGEGYPVIPTEAIDELREQFGDLEIKILPEDLTPGTEVTVTEQPFYGMQAVVLRAMPAKERVQVLLEMLGRTTQVEVSMQSVLIDQPNRWRGVLEPVS